MNRRTRVAEGEYDAWVCLTDTVAFPELSDGFRNGGFPFVVFAVTARADVVEVALERTELGGEL